MNSEIEIIFKKFLVPVCYLKYTGNEKAYITYQEIQTNDDFDAEDDMQYIKHVYDFDVYSKTDYTKVVKELKQKLKDNGWTWLPDNSSSDMYEDDTGYYHKTLCFSKNEYIGG